ncbi:polysaccharide deacetylase family protein [Vagococcus zengguangii]|uniref:Polysaccharide deacetylase family protein n=1 Tax=Vagococcus zengguangii TaxID=2571750 RepID=A0A4D7CNN9_9ENTE|nr:polysaccharide deacetylase family protein [Vagococcus zengguangii]QCI85688.1 polysaccharide deacetylase family protein [Vagococcus zengguangii]TLG81628.1 polysaccharide deacetylase family protein [Vagococcus zengguangii]
MRKKIISVLVTIIFIELMILSIVFISKNNANKKETPQLHKNEVLVDSSQVNVSKIDETAIVKRNMQIPDSSKWESATEGSDIQFPIIAYSYLNNQASKETLSIENFTQQLEWLKKEDYYTLTPQEAYEVLTKNKKPAEKIIWLTFDNGYYNQYKFAFPLLQRYKMQATINYLPNKEGNVTYANLYDLQEMLISGEINVESGTANGLALTDLKPSTLTTEIKQSKETLDTTLKQTTTTIAYPENSYNDDIIEVAEEAGYKLGLTTNTGLASKSNGLLSLSRIEISNDLPIDEFTKLIGAAN